MKKILYATGERQLDDAIESVLASEHAGEFENAGYIGYKEGLLNKLSLTKADIVLFTDWLPGNQKSLDLMLEIKRHYRNTRIIFLTSFNDNSDGYLSSLVTYNIYDFIASDNISIDSILDMILNPRTFSDVEVFAPNLTQSNSPSKFEELSKEARKDASFNASAEEELVDLRQHTDNTTRVDVNQNGDDRVVYDKGEIIGGMVTITKPSRAFGASSRPKKASAKEPSLPPVENLVSPKQESKNVKPNISFTPPASNVMKAPKISIEREKSETNTQEKHVVNQENNSKPKEEGVKKVKSSINKEDIEKEVKASLSNVISNLTASDIKELLRGNKEFEKMLSDSVKAEAKSAVEKEVKEGIKTERKLENIRAENVAQEFTAKPLDNKEPVDAETKKDNLTPSKAPEIASKTSDKESLSEDDMFTCSVEELLNKAKNKPVEDVKTPQKAEDKSQVKQSAPIKTTTDLPSLTGFTKSDKLYKNYVFLKTNNTETQTAVNMAHYLALNGSKVIYIDTCRKSLAKNIAVIKDEDPMIITSVKCPIKGKVNVRFDIKTNTDIYDFAVYQVDDLNDFIELSKKDNTKCFIGMLQGCMFFEEFMNTISTKIKDIDYTVILEAFVDEVLSPKKVEKTIGKKCIKTNDSPSFNSDCYNNKSIYFSKAGFNPGIEAYKFVINALLVPEPSKEV